MGHISVEGKLTGPLGTRRVRFLVDTGATMTRIPAELADALGIVATGRRRFQLADDRLVERPVGEVWIEILGQGGTTPVSIGPRGQRAILGVLTLEILWLEVDPVHHRLKAMEFGLMLEDVAGHA